MRKSFTWTCRYAYNAIARVFIYRHETKNSDSRDISIIDPRKCGVPNRPWANIYSFPSIRMFLPSRTNETSTGQA